MDGSKDHFKLCSPSMSTKYKSLNRLSKNNFTEVERRLEKEKKASLRDLDRQQASFLRDSIKRTASRPVSWHSVGCDMNKDAGKPKPRKRRASIKTTEEPIAERLLQREKLTNSARPLNSEVSQREKIRREATYYKSLNQICNASETVKQEWDKIVIRQMARIDLNRYDDYDQNDWKQIETYKAHRRRTSQSLKCRSQKLGCVPVIELDRSRSLVIRSSDTSLLAEMPRYIRQRPNTTLGCDSRTRQQNHDVSRLITRQQNHDDSRTRQQNHDDSRTHQENHDEHLFFFTDVGDDDDQAGSSDEASIDPKPLPIRRRRVSIPTIRRPSSRKPSKVQSSPTDPCLTLPALWQPHPCFLTMPNILEFLNVSAKIAGPKGRRGA